MSVLHAVATAAVPEVAVVEIESAEDARVTTPSFSYEVNDHFAFQFAMCFIVACFLVAIFMVEAIHTLGLLAAAHAVHAAWIIN